jgi:hypothetical protein
MSVYRRRRVDVDDRDGGDANANDRDGGNANAGIDAGGGDANANDRDGRNANADTDAGGGVRPGEVRAVRVRELTATVPGDHT